MVPGMIADGMAPLCDATDDFRILADGIAQHEEGSARMMPFQDVQQTNRVIGVRPIVEGQSCYLFTSRHMRDGAEQGLSHRPEYSLQDGTAIPSQGAVSPYEARIQNRRLSFDV